MLDHALIVWFWPSKPGWASWSVYMAKVDKRVTRLGGLPFYVSQLFVSHERFAAFCEEMYEKLARPGVARVGRWPF